MKKMTMIITCLTLMSLTACKKDRTCTCTDDDGDKTTTNFYKVKKNDVRDNCVSYQTTSYDASRAESFTGQKRTCELK